MDDQTTPVPQQAQQEPGIIEQIAQTIFPEQVEPVPEQVEPVLDQVAPDTNNVGLMPQETGALLPEPVSPYVDPNAIIGNQPGDVTQQTDYQNEQTKDTSYVEVEVNTPVGTVRAGHEHEETANTGEGTTTTSTNL